MSSPVSSPTVASSNYSFPATPAKESESAKKNQEDTPKATEEKVEKMAPKASGGACAACGTG